MLAVLLSLTLFFSQAEIIDRVYATVNDEIITDSDIDEYQRQLKSRLLYEDLLFPDEKAITAALNDKQLLIEKIIGEKILDSEAKKLGINITEDRVNKEVQAKGGVQHLTGLLKQKNLTLQDYKDFLTKSLARREVINYFVSSKIKVADDDIMDFYVSASKGAVAGQGFEYNLSHILIDPRSTKSKDAARALAVEARKAIEQGQSFASVHRRYSSNKEESFGTFKSGEILPVIESSISQLKAGETSGVVESPMGFHVFRLNSKRVVNNPDFEKRKQQIFQYLYTKSYSEQLTYWLGQKRRSAVIKINEKK
jgi:peptidyl-prolyl cis-trans isomerase SurA